VISTELIRRYPFFAGLTREQIAALATLATEITANPGHYFFREGDTLGQLLFVIDGQVDIVISVTDRSKNQPVAEQLMGNFTGKDVTVSIVRPGHIFAWSALIPPHVATAGAKATTSCRVIAFDHEELSRIFDKDAHLGYLVLQKTAGVVRQRLREMRLQSLGLVTA